LNNNNDDDDNNNNRGASTPCTESVGYGRFDGNLTDNAEEALEFTRTHSVACCPKLAND
jgi:hypothetical protein